MSPVRMLVLAFSILLLFVVGLHAFQDRYLYFPDTPTLAEFASAHPGLEPWPDAGGLRGLMRKPKGAARATVIIFHGNAGHAGHRGWYADQLGALGMRVILAEYPGYGPRPGKSGEESLIADAARTIALARKSFGAPVLVIGESLGAAVAAGAVARDPSAVAGLMLITPWDRLSSVARHHYGPLVLPWLLRDRYDSVAALQALQGQVLIVVAESDSIVPARFGRALFDNLPARRKRLLMVSGADHNDWWDHADDAWWFPSLRFLLGEDT